MIENSVLLFIKDMGGGYGPYFCQPVVLECNEWVDICMQSYSESLETEQK